MNDTENMSLKEESQEEHFAPQNPPQDLEVDKHSPEFESFLKVFNEQPDADGKLQMAIDFMERSISTGGTPHFRSFWEARRLCLPLFKEHVSPLLRGHLWNKYSELSKEARRLKEILDEQSAFAVEQIEIAIVALEKEIESSESYGTKSIWPEGMVFPHSLKNQFSLYEDIQKQLVTLNVHASRINGLRKELLKTEMRVRHKNKFFQRLSEAGDKVFPKRKELIKQISQQFTDDVDHFIKSHFTDIHHDSLYNVREEIKTLQGLAKVLTLNTNAFSHTRMRLSECWDKMRTEEKERKKERAQQKSVYKQNAEMVAQQFQETKELFEKGVTVSEGQKKIDEMVILMRQTQLGRDELPGLRDSLNALRKMIQDKARSEEEIRHQHEDEKNRQKKEKYNSLKDQADKLFRQYEAYDVETLTAERDALAAKIQEAPLTKIEKQELERMLKPLRDAITEKKEKALLNLSDDDRQSLQQLKEVLKQRRERRQEIKSQLEALRKASGSSSLDFEKAFAYTHQINEEKERLDKANQGIEEVEATIAEIQSKLKNK